ncbi:MAG: glycosyltransferase [Bacteroidota bacterium]
MSETKVVLASVLKPVDDSRTYEKIGYSLSQTKKYEVNIIGFEAKNITLVLPNINLYPAFNFNRLSVRRVIAPFTCLKYYLNSRPDVIIFNTHELILVSVLYKLLFGTRLCYDVRENYYRNIKYGKGFPSVFRGLLAGYVRAKEYLSRSWIDHYFIAEENYEKEFIFTLKKSTVIQNKFHNIHGVSKVKKRGYTNLIFSGTLGETTGIFQAIDLAKSLHKIEPNIQLKIMGRAAQKSTLTKIKKEIENYSWISLIGGDILVNHSLIIEAISKADLGLICYPKNKSTEGSIPTKLYEYLALELPILLEHNPSWEQVCSPYSASVNINFTNFNPQDLWQEINRHEFYISRPGPEVEWPSEAEKLIHILNTI